MLVARHCHFPYGGADFKTKLNFPNLHENTSHNIRKVPLNMRLSKDSDQPVYVYSLIRIITGCILDSQNCKISSCGLPQLQTDCVVAQADLSSLGTAYMT